MTTVKLSRAQISALPEDKRFAAILEWFTPEERELLESAADRINALSADKQREMGLQIAAFVHNRIAN